MFKYKCNLCNKELKVKVTHIGNIVLLASGGSNDDGNLQCVCTECPCGKQEKYNQHKHVKPFRRTFSLEQPSVSKLNICCYSLITYCRISLTSAYNTLKEKRFIVLFGEIVCNITQWSYISRTQEITNDISYAKYSWWNVPRG